MMGFAEVGTSGANYAPQMGDFAVVFLAWTNEVNPCDGSVDVLELRFQSKTSQAGWSRGDR
jgi:hypothetical protein